MIFGLFKKKKRNTAEVAINAASGVLQVQVTIGGATPQRLMSDNFCLGYMFGFHDAILQSLEIQNEAEGFAIMTVSYHRLFGDESTGGQILRRSLDLQRDQTFVKGMFAGGQEAIEFIRDKTPPMGLAARLRGSQD